MVVLVLRYAAYDKERIIAIIQTYKAFAFLQIVASPLTLNFRTWPDPYK